LESGVCSLSPDQFVLGTETRRTKLSSACNLWSHQFLYCFKSTPDITRRPAEVWKRMCQRTSLILACSRLDRTQTVDPGFNEKNVAHAFCNLRLQGHDKHRAIESASPLFRWRTSAHSVRNACIGSIRDALQAGTRQASAATTSPQLRSSPDGAAECRQASTGSGVPLRCWLPGQAHLLHSKHVGNRESHAASTSGVVLNDTSALTISLHRN